MGWEANGVSDLIIWVEYFFESKKVRHAGFLWEWKLRNRKVLISRQLTEQEKQIEVLAQDMRKRIMRGQPLVYKGKNHLMGINQ